MENTAFEITREYIFDNRTSRGAWTRAQIEALGLEWPATQGWIDELAGTTISLEQARKFENGKHIRAGAKTKNVRQQIHSKIKGMNAKQLNMLNDLIDSILEAGLQV